MAHDSGLDCETLSGGTPDDDPTCPVCGGPAARVLCDICGGEPNDYCRACGGAGSWEQCCRGPHTPEQIAAHQQELWLVSARVKIAVCQHRHKVYGERHRPDWCGACVIGECYYCDLDSVLSRLATEIDEAIEICRKNRNLTA